MTMLPQKLLMCNPHRFGVNYVINPWMEKGFTGGVDKDLAWKQWINFKEILVPFAEIFFVTPQPDVPDLIFTANAGFVINNKVVVSRFRTRERQKEEPFYRAWFEKNGYTLAPWPDNVSFEGAGDALLDREHPIIWCGHGYRTDAVVPSLLEKLYERRTITLHLTDPRFYHLDTCFCPLAGGYIMYYPEAFDAESQKRIHDLVPENKRIVVKEEDAMSFSCNAVDLGGSVVMNAASNDLQNKLRQAHFTPIITPLSEFLKAGGAAKCLTLKLVET